MTRKNQSEVRIRFRKIPWDETWAHTALRAAEEFMGEYRERAHDHPVLYTAGGSSRAIIIRWTQARAVVAEVVEHGDQPPRSTK